MSVYNPFPQSLLQELENMSTDIRQQKKDIAAAKAAGLAAQGTANTALATGQAAQSVADAAATALQVISGTVQTISAEMVRKFTSAPIAAAAFVLDVASGYYYATISHMLGDAAPDIEVYDNDKDKQSVQSILVDSDTIKLELSQDEMNTNSFPLKCICLGKNTPVQPVVGAGLAGADVPGMSFMVRLNQTTIERSEDGGTTWLSLNNGDALNVETALIDTNGLVHVKLLDGFYHYGAGNSTEWTASNSAVYAAAAAEVNAIVL